MFSRVGPGICEIDLDRAIGFYGDALGFAVGCVDDPPVRAVVVDGPAVLHLDLRPERAGTSLVHMIVADLNAVRDRRRAVGVALRQSPTGQSWGLREAVVADPDGNTLELAQPIDRSRPA